MRERWQTSRGPILLTVGVASLVLGTIGYLELKVTPRYGLFDAFYRSMALFGLGGSVAPPVPVPLQIARICAPFITGYAAIGAFVALTREQGRVLGIRLFARDHIVVAGLGATGRRLAMGVVDQSPVVVIESQQTSEHLTGARVRGVRTLIGNAADPKLLRQAGIQHARTLVIACGSSGTNVDVAAAAVRALPPRRRPLTIFVHLDDLDLWSSLAAEGATFASERPDVRLEYFNAMAVGAQLLLERHPPFAEVTDPEREHVLLVGVQGVGEQLILQLARRWVSEGRPGWSGRSRLRVTITGEDAEQEIASLRHRHRNLEDYVQLAARPLAVHSAAFGSGAAMAGESDACDVTRAYVTLVDEADGLLAALALHARPDAAAVPVTVAVADARAGVSGVLGTDRGRFRAIETFGVLSEATGADVLLRGTNELLARAQHAQWLRHQRDAGLTVRENPHLRPWEELTEDQRENNRRFADEVHAKLELVGCRIVPEALPDLDSEPFAFTDEELELLARHEHVRWMDTMRANGWRYGARRDDARRIHDQIKPWEELDELNRDKDRDAVREIPPMLARGGFAIQRSSERTLRG